MNELDKLRIMLEEAEIPYENRIELNTLFNKYVSIYLKVSGSAAHFSRNQIIYGRIPNTRNDWKFDGICQYGSYGADEGMIETYGSLGSDEEGQPRVMTAAEAFEIIKKDYEESKNEEA